MSYTNRKFNWDFDTLNRFYNNFVVKWLNAAMSWTAAQKKQARANLGFGNGDIDNVPTAGSDNLVKSGGVQNELALGAVYDVSAKNPTAGPNNDGKWASIGALLSDANLNTLIPTGVRKGGMSIKFVQSSDNKYVQYRYMLQPADNAAFVNTNNWVVSPVTIETENPEFTIVLIDANKRVLIGCQKDGNFYFGAGVPKQVIAYVEEKYKTIEDFIGGYLNDTTLQELLNVKVDKIDGKSLIDADFANGVSYIENPEFLIYALSANKKVLFGSRKDGDFFFGNGVPSQILEALFNKIDKDPEKSLVDIDIASAQYTIDNPEWKFLILNSNKKIVAGVKIDDSIVWSIGVPQPIIDYLHDYNKFPIDFGIDAGNSWLVVGGGNEGGRNNYCIALGKRVMTNNTGIKNMTVGYDNLKDCTGSDNTSMGYHASFRNTSGQRNAAFGSESQDDNTQGSYNTSMGFCSLQRNNVGDGNVAIGAFALQGTGSYDPQNVRDLDGMVAIGLNAMFKATSGSYQSIAIGPYAFSAEKQYKNCIGIGYNVASTKDNQTVIGNDNTVETIVRGNLIVKGSDGISRQIVFNQDGVCNWTEVS